VPDRHFRILLIEDNPGDARLMREYLGMTSSCVFDVTWADTLARGLAALAQSTPDLIVSDLGLPDSKGLDTFSRVHERAGRVPVIVLTGLDDESVAVEAIRQGAQDYLVKGEVRGTALVRAVRYAIERERAAAVQRSFTAGRARVLAFVGSKGGVGTSTVAVNVATALASANRSVILAELRPWPGTLSRLLQVAPAASNGDLSAYDDGAISGYELASQLCRLPSGLRVLFGPRSYDDAGLQPANIECVLAALRSSAEYVVLDVLPYPPDFARAALRGCDFVALVAEPDRVSLACAGDIATVLRTWGIGQNSVGLVTVNRTAAEQPALDELRTLAGCEVLGMIPRAPDRFPPSQRPGPPVVEADPASQCAATLVELAGRLASEPVVSPFL
jgi:DNA-binding response OmpR family regulator